MATRKPPEPKTLFECDSPRARGTLRSFLTNFLVDDTVTGRLSIRDDIDLEQHAIDTGQSVSK